MRKRVKILVIDDDGIILESMKRTFEGEGFKEELAISQCSSVEEAEKAIREHRPTHLFLDDDFGSPRNGVLVAAQLQAQSRKRCKIFSTTGSTNEGILAEYRKLKVPVVRKGGMVTEIKKILKIK